MSAATEMDDICSMVRSLLPPLDPAYHKGKAGRIGVIGGCKEYTGAPYFAAVSALKLGCDLAHVFCTGNAAPVIKSYSPELIVHPILDSASAKEDISEWLPRLHSVIIGPGLGRDENVFENLKGILKDVLQQGIPVVIDADGLFFINKFPDIIKGYSNVILTPNAVEYSRLHQVLMGSEPSKHDGDSTLHNVCTLLGNVTIIQKGKIDRVSNGIHDISCIHEGSPRRCGGQGDLLSGSLGVWAFWAHRAYKDPNRHPLLSRYGPSLCAGYAACWLTKECSKRAFQKRQRSMITSDMIKEIGNAVMLLESQD